MAVPNAIIANGKIPILGQFSLISPKFALFRLPSILLLLFLPKFVCPNAQTQQPTTIRRNEMLVPLNSTTALICEPVFNQGRPIENGDNDEDEARWMRDGREIARVNGHRNALIGENRGKGELVEGTTTIPQGQDPIPEIGFLLIRHTQREDEGEYWCERLGQDRQQGERTRLRVAYLEPFPKGTRPRVSFPPPSDQPERGQLVILDCPRPNGVPAPIISWQFNGEELRDFPALNLQMATNGSLLLHNFSSHQSGFYACEAVNFVAKTRSEPIFLGTPLITNHRRANGQSASTAFVECLSAYVRNGVLWFLIGCLTTSCIVLAYILGALFLYRLYSIRDRQHHRWPRSLFAAPGFRKVIAPMAERMAANQPPPYESPAESDTTTMTRNEQQFDV